MDPKSEAQTLENKRMEATNNGTLGNDYEDTLNMIKEDLEVHTKPVQRRLLAALNQQLKIHEIEKEFHDEVRKIEVQYAEKFEKYYEARRKIVVGEYEPTDEEVKFDKIELEALQCKTHEEETKRTIEVGIPEFWVNVISFVPVIGNTVNDLDLIILKHIEDISCDDTHDGFTLKFKFRENEYISNKVLTKQYFVKNDTDSNALSYTGPEIYKNKGCKICWEKAAGVLYLGEEYDGGLEIITQECDTFFRFFEPKANEITDRYEDCELTEEVESDFEVGHAFHEDAIPHAVSLYFGINTVGDEDFDDDDTDEQMALV